jgi:hypothetical protein
VVARMGATHFLTKTLPKVADEMALSVLAYLPAQPIYPLNGHQRIVQVGPVRAQEET